LNLLFIIATFVLAAAKGIRVEMPWVPVLASIGFFIYAFVYAYRSTWIAVSTWRVSQLLIFSAFFALLTDVVAYGCVLQDDWLLAADAALGINAREWAEWMNSNRAVHRVMHIAYFSLIPQLILACLMSGKAIIKWLQVSAFITVVGFALCPAMGTYSETDIIDHNAPIKQRMDDLSSMEVGVLRIQDCEGIICMPSFHTICGCLLIAAFWPSRLRYWIVGLNVLMIVSTIPIGAHYVVDVIAGILVATFVIKTVR